MEPNLVHINFKHNQSPWGKPEASYLDLKECIQDTNLKYDHSILIQ